MKREIFLSIFMIASVFAIESNSVGHKRERPEEFVDENPPKRNFRDPEMESATNEISAHLANGRITCTELYAIADENRKIELVKKITNGELIVNSVGGFARDRNCVLSRDADFEKFVQEIYEGHKGANRNKEILLNDLANLINLNSFNYVSNQDQRTSLEDYVIAELEEMEQSTMDLPNWANSHIAHVSNFPKLLSLVFNRLFQESNSIIALGQFLLRKDGEEQIKEPTEYFWESIELAAVRLERRGARLNESYFLDALADPRLVAFMPSKPSDTEIKFLKKELKDMFNWRLSVKGVGYLFSFEMLENKRNRILDGLLVYGIDESSLAFLTPEEIICQASRQPSSEERKLHELAEHLLEELKYPDRKWGLDISILRYALQIGRLDIAKKLLKSECCWLPDDSDLVKEYPTITGDLLLWFLEAGWDSFKFDVWSEASRFSKFFQICHSSITNDNNSRLWDLILNDKYLSGWLLGTIVTENSKPSDVDMDILISILNKHVHEYSSQLIPADWRSESKQTLWGLFKDYYCGIQDDYESLLVGYLGVPDFWANYLKEPYDNAIWQIEESIKNADINKLMAYANGKFRNLFYGKYDKWLALAEEQLGNRIADASLEIFNLIGGFKTVDERLIKNANKIKR